MRSLPCIALALVSVDAFCNALIPDPISSDFLKNETSKSVKILLINIKNALNNKKVLSNFDEICQNFSRSLSVSTGPFGFGYFDEKICVMHASDTKIKELSSTVDGYLEITVTDAGFETSFQDFFLVRAFSTKPASRSMGPPVVKSFPSENTFLTERILSDRLFVELWALGIFHAEPVFSRADASSTKPQSSEDPVIQSLKPKSSFLFVELKYDESSESWVATEFDRKKFPDASPGAWAIHQEDKDESETKKISDLLLDRINFLSTQALEELALAAKNEPKIKPGTTDWGNSLNGHVAFLGFWSPMSFGSTVDSASGFHLNAGMENLFLGFSKFHTKSRGKITLSEDGAVIRQADLKYETFFQELNLGYNLQWAPIPQITLEIGPRIGTFATHSSFQNAEVSEQTENSEKLTSKTIGFGGALKSSFSSVRVGAGLEWLSSIDKSAKGTTSLNVSVSLLYAVPSTLAKYLPGNWHLIFQGGMQEWNVATLNFANFGNLGGEVTTYPVGGGLYVSW